VNITFANNALSSEVRVINALGQEVYYLSAFSAQVLTIDLPKTKGLYVVEITDNATLSTERFKLIRR